MSLPESSQLTFLVRRNLLRRCAVKPGDRLLIAVSGGADSTALLHLLLDIAPELDLELEVAHFDHALRASSEDDARLVRELAAKHALPFHDTRWEAPRPGEAGARAARYEFLTAKARERQATAVVLA